MAAREVQLAYGSLLLVDESGDDVKASLFYVVTEHREKRVTRQSARAATLEDALRTFSYPDNRKFEWRQIAEYVRSTDWGRVFA